MSITLAFCGPGEVDVQNVTDLLNDLIGTDGETSDGLPNYVQDDITLVIPVSDDYLTPGIQAVLEWATEEADLEYTAVTSGPTGRKGRKWVLHADNVIESVDVPATLVNQLKDSEGDAYLIVLWGEEGDENTEIALDLALSAGIRALDLTAGLDDISFDDGEASEPEPEPEKPARRSRKAKVEEPLEEEEQPLTEDPEPAPSPSVYDDGVTEEQSTTPDGQYLVTTRVHPTGVVVGTEKRKVVSDPRFSYYPPTHESVLLHQTIRTMAAAFVDTIEEMLPSCRERSLAVTKIEEASMWANAAIAREISAKAEDTPAPETPKEESTEPSEDEPVEDKPRRRSTPRGGRPRKDGTPAQPREEEDLAVAYILHEDGTYTKAGRGRPRAGQERKMLTPSQVKEFTEQGLIEDED